MKMFRTITAKVTVLSLVAVAVCVGVGAVSLRAVSDLRHRQQVAVVIQHALHNQSEIDGANHAAQYDALLAATADAQTREDTLEDLAERRDTLTGGIAENRDLLVPLGDSAGLARAFDAIAEPLAAYDAALAAIADAMQAGNQATDEQVEAVDAAFEGFDVPFDVLAEASNAYIADLDTQARLKASVARTQVLTLLVVGGLLILAFGLLIRRAIAMNLNQTEQILTVVDAATAGDLTGVVAVHGDDPIGRVGDGLGRLLTDLRGSVGSIKRVAERLAISSTSLLTVSGNMATTATETSSQAESMSTSAGQLSDNVGVVSEGTSDMETAMHHIATSAATAAGVASKAVQVAEETTTVVGQLDISSGEISDVVRVISAIAEQTNLLALNATIEAARAGDAGRGFAVVAAEVKDLAQETASATADVTDRIARIQSDARGAVSAIGEIQQIIGQINDIQANISAAVQQQTAISSRIGGSVADAAASSGRISTGISGMADAAGHTARGADDARQAAHELTQLSRELNELVGGFRH